MRGRSIFGYLLVLSVIALTACQPAVSNAVPTVWPTIQSSTPISHGGSGMHLTARIDSQCVTQSGAECHQPYAGEFVVTALNGAEVTRVTTDQTGEAAVALPPGEYLVGVKTEEIYPFAPPVKVNVLANQYEQVSLSLNSGQ